MKKKLNLIDIAVGVLAGGGVASKLDYTFNSPWKQTDIVSTLGFRIATIVIGCFVCDKCADWSYNTRNLFNKVYKDLASEKYASPKED